LARNRLGDQGPILGDRIGTGLVLPSPGLLIRAIAELADQRLGLSVNAFHSRTPGRRPGAHLSLPSTPHNPIAAYSRVAGNRLSPPLLNPVHGHPFSGPKRIRPQLDNHIPD